MELKRALAGRDGVGRALNEAEHVGDAHLGGEVVHFVVEQEAERAGGYMGAEAVVERGGDGDGIAFGVDNGVMRGVVRFGLAAAGGLGAAGKKPAGVRVRRRAWRDRAGWSRAMRRRRAWR